MEIHIGQILGHHKFKRIKIIWCLLSGNRGIKIEINNRKITGKSQNTWRLNKTLLNNAKVKEEISRQILRYLELNEKVHYWKILFLLKVTTFLDYMRHFGGWCSVYFCFKLQSGSEVLPISILSSTQSFVTGIGVRELVPERRNGD